MFEPDSQLSNIGEYAFDSCSSLQWIYIPGSLHQLSGFALAGSGIEEVTVDSGNRFLRVSGEFLTTFGEIRALR
jgi:hypothetical protein